MRWRALLIAALAGVAAFWGGLTITEPPGPGLDPDALAYLGAGVSLARHEGLRVPSGAWDSADSSSALVHFPPGFPVAIAAAIRAGATPVNAARFIEAGSAFITMTALFLIAWSSSEGWAVAAIGARTVTTGSFRSSGALAGIVVAAMAAATPALIYVHSSVLSEPLFLALVTCFVGVLASDRTGRETRRAVMLGVIASLATLVRYAGASLVLALLLDAQFFGAAFERTSAARVKRARRRDRIRRTAIAAVLPVATLGAWAATRPRAGGAESIRDVGLYTAGWTATLSEGAETVGRWLAPTLESGPAASAVALVVLAAVGALLVWTVRESVRGTISGDPERVGLVRPGELRLYRATVLTAISYVVVIAASRALADSGIPLDDRILSPLFLAVVLAMGVALAAWWRAAWAVPGKVALFLTVGLVFSWAAGQVEVAGGYVRELAVDGGDLAGATWRRSPLVAWAAAADRRTRLYSNWPAAIWFHTGRATLGLPETLDGATTTAFRAKLEREHAALLAFRQPSPDGAAPDSLAALAGLVAVARWPEGTVWRVPVPADTAGAVPTIRPGVRP